MEGWIKIHRKILNWEWYEDANTFRLFIHLLLSANSKNGSWQGKTLRRGQLITSVSKLSESLLLTKKQIRVSINKLKNTGEVASKGASKYTILTLCNYDYYQAIETPEGQTKGLSVGQTKGKQRANKGQTKGNKQEGKEYKKEKNKNIDRISFVSETFLPVWNDWLAWKNTIKDQYKTSEGAKRAYDKLHNLSNNDPIKAAEIIQNCIANEWKGIYPMREAVIKNISSQSKTAREQLFKRFESELNGTH